VYLASHGAFDTAIIACMRRLLKLGFQLLSAISPGLAAQLAARLWFAVPRPRVTEASRAFLATGTRFQLSVGESRVTGWRWGSGPVVLLMHGWGGHAAQLHAFVEPLRRAGFHVIAFDAPSHGASDPGRLGPRRATLFDFADTLVAVSRDHGEIAGVVAHSGGCAAAAWALVQTPAWPVQRMVFVAPFGSPARYMAIFQNALGLSGSAMRRFRESTERQFGFRWADFEVPAMADRVRTPPLLVIHDRDDRETAWQDGADIAGRWPRSELHTTTGLGHNRILRDASVVALTARFLSSGTPVAH
jgi:pimeloyl-ACP methyl ester carboxylesterase